MLKIVSEKGNIEVEMEGTYAQIMADATLSIASIISRMAKATGRTKTELKADFVTGLIIAD